MYLMKDARDELAEEPRPRGVETLATVSWDFNPSAFQQ